MTLVSKRPTSSYAIASDDQQGNLDCSASTVTCLTTSENSDNVEEEEESVVAAAVASPPPIKTSIKQPPVKKEKETPEVVRPQAKDDAMIFEMYAGRLSKESLTFLLGIEKAVEWNSAMEQDDDEDDDYSADSCSDEDSSDFDSDDSDYSDWDDDDDDDDDESYMEEDEGSDQAKQEESSTSASPVRTQQPVLKSAAIPSPTPPQPSSDVPQEVATATTSVVAPTSAPVTPSPANKQQLPTQASSSSPVSSSVLKKKNRVSFDTNHNGVVRRTVHKVRSIVKKDSSKSAVWWTPSEKQAMVKHFVATVDRYQTKEMDYIVTFTSLYQTNGFLKSREKEQCLQDLAAHCDARGLEHFIIKVPHLLRRQHLEHVLRAQEIERLRQMTHSSNSSEESMENIRRASVRASLACRKNASRMAEYDARQALEAMSSDWGKQRTKNRRRTTSGARRLLSRLTGHGRGHGRYGEMERILERSDSLKDMGRKKSASSKSSRRTSLSRAGSLKLTSSSSSSSTSRRTSFVLGRRNKTGSNIFSKSEPLHI